MSSLLRSSLGMALALGALFTLPSCGGASAKSIAPAPIPVQVATVERKTIAAFEVLDGQVDPYLQASLATQQSGTLVAVYANEGDHVRKDEVLAKIDDSVLRANLTQQQGLQTQSTAKLAQSQIQLPITDVSSRSALVQAERALEQAKKQEIADRANVANTKATFDGDHALLAQGFVASTTYEQARALYVAAQQTLAADDDKVVQAQAALRAAQQNLADTPLQRQVIEENRGAVVQSEGSVTQFQTAIAQTTLTAPFDGVVTARTLDPGAFASPSQAIFQISQVDPIYVDFNVKDTDLGFVGPGTLVSFSTSAHPERRYSGRVSSINVVPTSGTLLYRARIIERNPDFSLRGGLQVSVRITKDVHRAALAVPRGAITQNGSDGTIYAIERDAAASTPGVDRYVTKQITVHIGLQTNTFVEVSSPELHPGMPVVLGQVDTLRDAAPVSFPAH